MRVVALLFAGTLVLFAGRYGYHRDELYFLAAGRRLDWGYADQPPLTPLIARAMAALDSNSLALLRLPAILAATVVVVCAGLMARELGGGRAAQVLASAATASAAMVLGVGHQLNTAAFDLAAWTVVSLLMLMLLRAPEFDGADRRGASAVHGGKGWPRRVGGRADVEGVEGAGGLGESVLSGGVWDSAGEPSDPREPGGVGRRDVAGQVGFAGSSGGRADGEGVEGSGGSGESCGAGVWGGAGELADARERGGVGPRGAAEQPGVAGPSGIGGRVLDRGRGDASGVGGDSRWWLVVGVAVGVGLQNKFLLVFPVIALAVALMLVGPRKVFATRYFPVAVGIAAAIWLPQLWWQARNGWPQLELSRSIATGSSGTSDSPVMFVLLQFGLMGPLLVPLWVIGLWWLWRHVRYRAFAVSYVLLFVVFLVTGGKAYYLGGMYPILLAAGSVPVAAWLGARRFRWAVAGSVLAVNALVGALLFLPVRPVTALRDSPILAVNYDAGETVGWPELVRQVAEARAAHAPDAAIFTENYGEAGAIERFGAPYGLPVPHSGHNAYWWWGPPAEAADAVIVIGYDREPLERLFAEVEPAGRIDNGLGIDNDEQGARLYVCRAPRASWMQLWPELKHLG